MIKNLIAGAALGLMSFAAPLAADDYPERPVMLMVSYGAGGGY